MRPRKRSAGPARVVGVCRRCGVRFGGSPAQANDTRLAFEAHERICPGGGRAAELAIPFGPLRAVRIVARTA